MVEMLLLLAPGTQGKCGSEAPSGLTMAARFPYMHPPLRAVLLRPSFPTSHRLGVLVVKPSGDLHQPL